MQMIVHKTVLFSKLRRLNGNIFKCKTITNSKNFEENCDDSEIILPMDSIEISTEFLDFMTENNAKEVIVQHNQPPCDNNLKCNLEQLVLPLQADPLTEVEFETISNVDIETLLNVDTYSQLSNELM